MKGTFLRGSSVLLDRNFDGRINLFFFKLGRAFILSYQDVYRATIFHQTPLYLFYLSFKDVSTLILVLILIIGSLAPRVFTVIPQLSVLPIKRGRTDLTVKSFKDVCFLVLQMAGLESLILSEINIALIMDLVPLT